MDLSGRRETCTGTSPEGHGAYRIEGLDATGAAVFSIAFEGHAIADARRAARSFAFTIPLSSFDPARLSALRLAGPGGSAEVLGGRLAESLRSGAVAPSAKLSAGRAASGRTQLSWDGATYPMALIRDARTGQVLSFARGGRAEVASTGAQLEVVLSDGVRSISQRTQAQ